VTFAQFGQTVLLLKLRIC